MGRFYTNAVFRGIDAEAVAGELQDLGRVAGVALTVDEMTAVFDRASEEQDGSGPKLILQLTSQLRCVALYIENHDDGVLSYHLFKDGALVDRYCSAPYYFGNRSDDNEFDDPAGGDAKLLCQLFEKPGAESQVEEILRYNGRRDPEATRYAWEVDRHRDLAIALGLPLFTVGYGYTCLAHEDWPDGLSPDNIYSLGGADE